MGICQIGMGEPRLVTVMGGEFIELMPSVSTGSPTEMALEPIGEIIHPRDCAHCGSIEIDNIPESGATSYIARHLIERAKERGVDLVIYDPSHIRTSLHPFSGSNRTMRADSYVKNPVALEGIAG